MNFLPVTRIEPGSCMYCRATFIQACTFKLVTPDGVSRHYEVPSSQ